MGQVYLDRIYHLYVDVKWDYINDIGHGRYIDLFTLFTLFTMIYKATNITATAPPNVPLDIHWVAGLIFIDIHILHWHWHIYISILMSNESRRDKISNYDMVISVPFSYGCPMIFPYVHGYIYS